MIIPQQSYAQKRSFNNLLILLTDNVQKYTGLGFAFGAHIPPEHPKNFDKQKRSIILLSTKNNPTMMNFTLQKELGHFILQDVSPEEITRRFGYKGDWKTIGQQMVLREWMDWFRNPKSVKLEQSKFFYEQLNNLERGTPEIDVDIFYFKKYY